MTSASAACGSITWPAARRPSASRMSPCSRCSVRVASDAVPLTRDYIAKRTQILRVREAAVGAPKPADRPGANYESSGSD